MNADAIATIAARVRDDYERRVAGESAYKIDGADLARPRVQEALDGARAWSDVFTGKARRILKNQLASNKWNARAAKVFLEQEPERLSAFVRNVWADDLDAAAAELESLLADERLGTDVTAFRSTGAQASVLSFFRFLHDPRQHPIFRPKHVGTAFRQLGHPPLEGADPATVLRQYYVALDAIREAFVGAGLPLRHRLDTQAVLWACNSLPSEPAQDDSPDEEPATAAATAPEKGLPIDPDAASVLASQVPAIQAWLRSRGLRFPDDLVGGYLAALLTKPFVVLSGLSGTGKTRLALEVNALLGSVHVVPVKPDWTDTRGVLGYLNPLTREYEVTETLRAVLSAHATHRPVTLVLDEMNLAHVERYLADVLSAMESGHPIPLHGDETVEERQGIPRQLQWPANLLVVGTVNADETTYPFSPKVLDRAFVLDVSRVDARAYLTGDVRPAEVARPPLPAFLPTRDWRAMHVAHEDRAFILDLHAALDEAERPFGYRTINEALAFLTHARAFVTTGLRPQDALVATKVLPRFHGRRHELEPAITGLEALLRLDLDPANGALPSTDFPWSERLLRRMARQLDADGYVESMVG